MVHLLCCASHRADACCNPRRNVPTDCGASASRPNCICKQDVSRMKISGSDNAHHVEQAISNKRKKKKKIWLVGLG